MYSLHLYCPPGDVDLLSSELWEEGTVGVREVDLGHAVQLIAAFESGDRQASLVCRFADYQPVWEREDDIDWVQYTKDLWPGLSVGQALFLAPPWCKVPTPDGRIRLVHNPGLACGTGDHPCTQMALETLESMVTAKHSVLDIGTGSGSLAIAARLLAAQTAVGVDHDRVALGVAQENFTLNELPVTLVEGSVECVKDGFADITVANISSTVLLTILTDLIRATKPGGKLVLTGFSEAESAIFRSAVRCEQVLSDGEWRCVVGRTPLS